VFRLFPTDEVIIIIRYHDSDEQLLRSGGFTTILIDTHLGFQRKNITELHPSKIAINRRDDLEMLSGKLKQFCQKKVEK
jgi:hypothetical protein